jgi:hypothetical protein
MKPPYERPDPGMPPIMPDYNRAIMQVMPAVRHGLREVRPVSMKHAVTEAALIAYLIGRGYDHHQAVRIVESWERNESFPM